MVAVEVFGYGCTAEARQYEGMLVKIEGVTVQPCANLLTADKALPEVHPIIRAAGQYCEGNTLSDDPSVEDKYGQALGPDYNRLPLLQLTP